MIFVTGDTHGEHDIHKLNTIGFPEQKGLTRDDYVIICGDFGGVWNRGTMMLVTGIGWSGWRTSRGQRSG